MVARDWWGRVVFGKTFIEARSHLMVFRCAVLFIVLQDLGFNPDHASSALGRVWPLVPKSFPGKVLVDERLILKLLNT